MHTTNFNELSNAIVGKHPFEWLVYGEESITAADTCNDDNFTANWRNDPRGGHKHLACLTGRQFAIWVGGEFFLMGCASATTTTAGVTRWWDGRLLKRRSAARLSEVLVGNYWCLQCWCRRLLGSRDLVGRR